MECFVVVTVLWIFSVCLHEFGHAIVAYYGGDVTVKEKGYLTLNPLHYTHPVLSILMPVLFVMLGGIGLPGGAVYINHSLLRSRGWETWVSLAGPAMNIVLIAMISICFKTGLLQNNPESLASVSLGFLLYLQVSAVLLNLLPVPPLDGFQAIAPWLPADVKKTAYEWGNVAQFVVFIALWRVEPVARLFWDTVGFISAILGVDPRLGYAGFKAFRFWDHSAF
jgi:Zn-dependent protease